jgi:hypothetical protein
MAYTLDFDPAVRAGIDAMPPSVMDAFAEALEVLKLVPERGKPLNKDNPDGGVYQLPFAKDGLITYLLLEDQQRVDLLRVVWLDLG